jgi:hypothetical protein
VKKLPAGECIAFAYRFTFAQLGTIIGLIWLPMVMIAVLQFLPYGTGDAALSPQEDPNAFGAAFLRQIGYFLAITLLSAVICVAVTRQALGLRSGGAVVHFALGRAELRLSGGFLMLSGILLVLAVGTLLAMTVAEAALSPVGNTSLSLLVGGAIFLAGGVLVLVSALRLWFLLVPIAVAEDKISFERGWILTRGNFWRILSVVFVVTLPTTVVVFAASSYILGPDLSALMAIAKHMTMQEFLDRYRVIMAAHVPAILGANLIVAPFSLGLTLGASAAGYRALSEPAAPAAAA